MRGCRLLMRNPRLQSLLEWEGELPVGGKAWSPNCLDPSEAGGLSACLWELSLLQQHHYHPHVAAVRCGFMVVDMFTRSMWHGLLFKGLSGSDGYSETLRCAAVAYVEEAP
jgi:hypothetical protein